MLDASPAAGAQASVTVHGVEFTFNAAGADGNNWKINVVTANITDGSITYTNNTINLKLDAGWNQIEPDPLACGTGALVAFSKT